MPRIKRRRGGQPGNQNARKHGFYSPYLSREESRNLKKAIAKGAADPKAAAISVKLKSALAYDPDNRRVVREACRLLYQIFDSQYNLSRQEKTELRRLVRLGYRAARDKIAKTIEAKKAKNAVKSPGPFEAKIEKSPEISPNESS